MPKRSSKIKPVSEDQPVEPWVDAPVGTIGHAASKTVESSSRGGSATPPADDAKTLSSTISDHLTKARCVDESSVELTFADGFVASLTLSQLGLAAGKFDLRTAKATSTGLAVKPTNGRKLVIDSATLRYIADSAHATRLDEAIGALLIPSERLERIAAQNQPPQEWYDSTEE